MGEGGGGGPLHDDEAIASGGGGVGLDDGLDADVIGGVAQNLVGVEALGTLHGLEDGGGGGVHREGGLQRAADGGDIGA